MRSTSKIYFVGLASSCINMLSRTDHCHYSPLRLVTLAVQNSALTIIMHYSRVSTPPSRAYSAATAVLLNELLKGSISLAIAFARIERPPYSVVDSTFPSLSISGVATNSFWNPQTLLYRLRTLCREVFSADCWKLSIPAILYGMRHTPFVPA